MISSSRSHSEYPSCPVKLLLQEGSDLLSSHGPTPVRCCLLLGLCVEKYSEATAGLAVMVK